MPRTCTVCRSPDREAVDRDLLAGQPKRSIAAQYQLSEGSVQRHRAHVAQLALARHLDDQIAFAAVLAEHVARLEQEAAEVRARARSRGDDRLLIAALKLSGDHVGLMAKLAALVQSAEPDDRVQFEGKREARRLVAATVGTLDDAVEAGELSIELGERLRHRVAERLKGTEDSG